MNTELRRVVVGAEGRYLSDEEAGKFREYALHMAARLEAARRLEAAEDGIVRAAAEAFLGKHAGYAGDVPEARAKTERDMRLTLRYLAAAHVRQDMDFFRRHYAEWIGELLRSIVEPEILVSGQECLKAAIEEALDPLDSRSFVRYLDVFISELAA